MDWDNGLSWDIMTTVADNDFNNRLCSSDNSIELAMLDNELIAVVNNGFGNKLCNKENLVVTSILNICF